MHYLYWLCGNLRGDRSPQVIISEVSRCEDLSADSVGVKEAAEKLGISGEIGGKRPSGAKAHIDFVGFMRGLKPPPPSGSVP